MQYQLWGFITPYIKHVLAKLSVISNTYNTECACIAGDLNTEFSKSTFKQNIALVYNSDLIINIRKSIPDSNRVCQLSDNCGNLVVSYMYVEAIKKV